MSSVFKITLKYIERNSRLKLIKEGGISKRYQKILIDKYVNDRSIYDIADELGLTKESTYNLLHKARKDLEKKIYEQYDLYSDDVKLIIDTIRFESDK